MQGSCYRLKQSSVRYHHLVIPCHTISKENAPEKKQGRSRRRKERHGKWRSLKKGKHRLTDNDVI
jgi:hypothetical protein